MKRRRRIKIISCIMAVFLCFIMGITPLYCQTMAKIKTSLSDGTYTVKSFLRSATSEQASMGNAAIVQSTQLIVKNGVLSLRMECKPLTISLGTKKFTGYLARMSYYPGWTGGSSGVELPKDQMAEAVKVESYYKDIYDSYNDPKKGTDKNVKGKLYPHYLNLPVSENEKEVWVQVYVPVMESVSKGSGLQYARLEISWDTLKKVSDTVPDSFSDDQKKNETVEKGGLQYLLLSANSLLSHKEIYTKKTVSKLKTAIEKAQAVYTDPDAIAKQVNAQMKALSSAITSLKEKNKSTNPTTTTGQKESLDVKNLKDGIYSISGTMLKTDKKTKSMADKAVNHKIQLTVKNGKYSLSLDFQGLNINSQFGYLSKMKYFTSDYKTDRYGAPSGTLKNVIVNSYQKDAKGKKVKDVFGTNYPNKVTFPLIKEALNNGYVPLQVFVPIMESISPGSGNQALFLKLDLSSVKSVKSIGVFKDNQNKNTGRSSGQNSSSVGFKTDNSVDVSSLSGSESRKLPEASFAGNEGTQQLAQKDYSTAQSTFSGANTENTQTQTITGNSTVKTMTEDGDSPVVVPSVMSVLVSIAGFFYKVKSRG